MKISVPISLATFRRGNFDELNKMLIQLNAKEIIICVGFCKSVESASPILEEIKGYYEYFSKLGYDIAIWIRTLDTLQKNSYTLLTDFNGNNLNSWKCPLNKEFVDDYCEYVSLVAKTGIKKILLEDDFRMQNTYYNAACFCDEHMALYSKILGKTVTRSQMREMVFNSQPNEYRSAWLKANQDVLENFAKRIRKSIDSVDDSIKIRLCVGPALFGGDGSDPIALANILRNKDGYVEFRLIGAPYWEWMFNVDLRSAVDFARHQALECKKHNITLIGEGDPFPRPRFAVSAADLEFFHTVWIADGNFDGIQKYALDYLSDCAYETGYAKATENNAELYKKIKQAFSGKKCVGFYAVEPFDAVKYAESIWETPEYRVMHSPSRKFLNDLSMPLCYEKGGVNVIFGNNACNIDRTLLKNGSVIDVESALILQKQGIDVGLISAERLTPVNPTYGYSPNTEFYHKYNDKNLILEKTDFFYRLTIKDEAKIQSNLQISNCNGIGSYTYENKNGERFLVYNFNADDAVNNIGHIRNYYRQRQLFDLHEWLNGNKLDAVWIGNPDLYTLIKKDENTLTVGFWNRSKDPTMNEIIALGEKYRKVKFVGFKGTLNGDEILVSSPVPPYGFGMIELFK